MKPPTTNGPSTRMPSVKLALGKYVTLRPRNDGTYRVLMEVPARLRPSGWSPAIPLPITGARTGNLTDIEEVGRIEKDARALYVKLCQARTGTPAAPLRGHPHSIHELIRSWESGQHYKGTKPVTQRGYSYHAGLIDDWSDSLGHPDVATLPFERIEQFLAMYDDRPTTRRHVKIVFKMLIDHARKLGWWKGENPLKDMKMGAPKSNVVIWEREDVDLLVAAARAEKWPVVAAMILTEWEIGQRLTDLILFRRGAEYKDRAFRFWQEKTREYVTIPISEALGDLLEEIAVEGSPYLFVNRETGQPFDGNRLSCVFRLVRKASKTGRKLTFRALRHSCVVQLARAGCDVPEIASITGHSLASAEQILSRYLPRDNEVAWNAQAKRGLITGAYGRQTAPKS